MKKYSNLFYSICFITITTIMIFLLSNLLRDKETTLSAMYSEPDNSVDVIIVGSSHVNNGYIPNVLWKNNNLSACNVYSWSQPMWTSYHYIKETLKTQSPEVIVLEMYGMLYGNSYIQPQEIDKTNYANSFNIDIGLNYFKLIHTAENVGVYLRPYEDFLNLPRFHTRWKNLNSKMITYNPHKDNDPLKGYGLTFNSNPTFANPEIKTDTVFEPYEFSIEYLDKIVDLCAKKDIQLIFTLTPYIYNEREAEIYNWINEYSESHNIPFFNYNMEDGKRIGFDFSKDLSDNGHANYFGAIKLTNDLSNILNSYISKEKSEHFNSNELDNDFEKYKRIISAYDIMTITDVEQYLSLVANDKNYSLFVINENTALSDDFFKILETNNIQLPTNKNHFTLAINIDGKNFIDAKEVEFNLFNKKGTVRFEFSPEDVKICLNNQEVFASASSFKMVLYDNVLGRPLETVSLSNGELKHKEFTSDIINLFKK